MPTDGKMAVMCQEGREEDDCCLINVVVNKEGLKCSMIANVL